MGRYTIRCEGLAYETSRDDLTSFFGGNGIIRMDIPRKSNGDAKGDATVVFDNEADFKEALNKNKQVLGRRYVEVYAEDEPRARGGGGSGSGNGNGGGGGRPRDAGPRRGGGGGAGGGADVFRHGEVAVRMTGLPYDANIRDVEHFFHPIPIVKNGVIMPKDLKENRGECFVVFPDREAGYWALKRHKNYIGKRFIDVCSASYTEVNTFCKTNGKRVPYGTNIDRERSQMTPRMMTPGMPPAPGPLMRPDPFGRDYRPGPDPFEHADPYGMARARPPMGGGPYGREPRPLMDYYSDGHEDPYYHRSGGGAPPMPLFASAGRGDPREHSPYYGREAAPMGREDSWRDEAKYDMKELGRYGNGGDYGRSPWDNEFDRRMDPYQSNGGGPIRGSSSSGRDGRGGGSRAAAPWERPMLPMGDGGGMMVDNAAAGGNFGAIERMAAERRGGTRYRLKMRGVPFRATEDDVYSFFAPIRPERIDIMTESGGDRPSGEVRVEFSSQQDYDEALKKDKQYMGPRYVELFADLR